MPSSSRRDKDKLKEIRNRHFGRPEVKRDGFSAQMCNKDKLEEIRNHHFANGDSHMSMTRIFELLIDKEHKRLKL